MHQILLLFRKDLSRFFPEILFGLLTIAAFTAFYPYTWLPHEIFSLALPGSILTHDALGTLPLLCLFVLPISWLVVIGRVVQDESLVGDRQYWVTRPIAWRSLLLEKLLFLTLFLILPFFFALLILLGRAGFSPAANAPRTLLLLLLDSFAFILPLFVLATLTRNFFRLFLTILSLLAAIIVIALAADSTSSVFTPYTDVVSFPLFIITCLTVVLIQYSSRTVWLARGFFALSLTILAVFAVNPFESRMLETLYYPVAAPHEIPVNLAIDTDPSRNISLETFEKETSISIPISVADVPYGFQITPDDAQLTIRDAHGLAHSTAWHAIYNRAYTVNTHYGVIVVPVDKAMLQQLRSGSVTLELQLALSLAEYGSATRITIPEAVQFNLPGIGICVRDPDLSSRPGLTCRYPLREPPLTLLAGTWTTLPCSAGHSPLQDAAILTASPGSRSPTPVDVSLTSVLVKAVEFSLPASTDTNLTELPPVHLCPGSTLTLTPLTVRRRARVLLKLPDFHLIEHPLELPLPQIQKLYRTP